MYSNIYWLFAIRYLIPLISVLSSSQLAAQEIRHTEHYSDSRCFHCASKVNWKNIPQGPLRHTAPFNMILHLSTKRKNEAKHYATASFIAEDLLLTARHTVMNNDQLEFIELYSNLKLKWIKLNKNDFEVYYYTQEFMKFEQDIVVIRIVNKLKLSFIYQGNFKLVENGLGKRTGKDSINVSGYPCVRFAIKSFKPDTLVTRSALSDLFVLNPEKLIRFSPLSKSIK